MAEDGDRVLFRQGEILVRPRGEDRFYPEEDFKNLAGLEYGNQRLLGPEDYRATRLFSRAEALSRAGLPLSTELSRDLAEAGGQYFRNLDFQRWKDREYSRIYPQNVPARQGWYRSEMGRYVPPGWILPLGDNRDNSRDGRYFGPVPVKKILGRAMFIYWPLERIRIIR